MMKHFYDDRIVTQLTFSSSKSAIETVEKGLKNVQI